MSLNILNIVNLPAATPEEREALQLKIHNEIQTLVKKFNAQASAPQLSVAPPPLTHYNAMDKMKKASYDEGYQAGLNVGLKFGRDLMKVADNSADLKAALDQFIQAFGND